MLRIITVLLVFAVFSELATAQVSMTDINPGFPGSNPSGMIEFNGEIYFAAQDGVNGRELWKTNGTEAGTVMVSDINPGIYSSNPVNFFVFKGYLYFEASTSQFGSVYLHRTNGTTIEIVTNFWSSLPLTYNQISNFTPSGSLFYFTNNTGGELWASDGTVAGTQKVTTGVSPHSHLRSAGDTVLYFNYYTSFYGEDPFLVIGRSNKGRVDVNPNLGNSDASNFLKIGNRVFFTATRDKETSSTSSNIQGNEMWYSNIYSSPNGFNLVQNINTSDYEGSYPQQLFNWSDSVILFSADNGVNGRELWKTNVNTLITTLVKNIVTGGGSSNPISFIEFNDAVYFIAEGGKLWKTDGTTAGTVLVFDAATLSNPLFRINEKLYFLANDATNGYELWSSDGTTAGTILLKDINPGTASGSPVAFSNLNNSLIFNASTDTTGQELFSLVDSCNALEARINGNRNNGFCKGSDIVVKGQIVGGNPGTFRWILNNAAIGSGIDSVLVNQTGALRLIVERSGCSDTSDAVIINALDTPSVNISFPSGGDASACVGETVIISASSGTNYKYQWFKDNAAHGSESTFNALNINTSGSYKARIRNAECIVTTNPVDIVFHPAANAPTVGALYYLCTGDSVIVDAGAGFTKYTWDGVPGGSRTKVYKTAGNYSIEVFTAFDCMNSQAFTITAATKPLASFTNNNGTLTATAVTGASYQWFKNAQLIPGANQISYKTIDAADYTVRVTSPQNCVSFSASQFVVSIGDDTRQLDFEIYPNPADNILSVILENKATQIEISDVQGRVIKTVFTNSSIDLNIEEIENGFYFVKVSQGDRYSIRKIIIQ